MKTSTLFTTTLLILTGQSLFGDDLFSDVEIDSVYQSSGTGQQQAPVSRIRKQKVTDQSSLVDLLLELGIESEIAEDRVVISLKREAWTIPCHLVLNDDALTIVFKLANIKDLQQLTSNQLLEMMQVSVTSEFVMLANRQVGQIQLRRTLPLRAVDRDQVKSDLKNMLDLAMATTSLWDFVDEKTPQMTVETAPVNETPVTQSSLSGTWLATPNENDAFALEMTEQSTFKLVVVSGKDVQKASGQFSISENQLTLTGDDGTKISGAITIGKETFELITSQGTKLSFSRQ